MRVGKRLELASWWPAVRPSLLSPKNAMSDGLVSFLPALTRRRRCLRTMLVEKWETQQMVAWDVYHTLVRQSRPETSAVISHGWREETATRCCPCKYQERHLISCEANNRISSSKKKVETDLKARATREDRRRCGILRVRQRSRKTT